MSEDLRALQAANDVLEALAIDQGERVDIYDALDKCGLFLTFDSLQGVLGVSLPKLGGVMVTTQRRNAIQRFTAAHELGHCILHSNELMIIDDEALILHASLVDQERQAQLFASAFLMPSELALSVADRYNIQSGLAAPPAVGRAARDMGVSYEATARRLVQLNRLTPTDQDELMLGRPRWRREELFGIRPARNTLDVWGVRASTASLNLTVALGDQITILFPENRTTGYHWILDEEANPGTDGAVAIVGDEFRLSRSANSESVVVGQQGERLISLQAVSAGPLVIEWRLARPFDPSGSVVDYRATFEILPSPADQRVGQILSTPLDETSTVQYLRLGGGE